jgi:heme/copper-type cytochrome/quinol oxidase subunit 2
MSQASRPRRPAFAAAAALIVVSLLLAACDVGDVKTYPNSTFIPHSEFGNAINDLWNLLLRLGMVVFVFVEGLLVYTIIK